MTEFYGKYRGTVADNVDPLKLGRIKAQVPAISGAVSSWALPCTPYAGPHVGWYVIPPVGAHVWIEFEAGDVDYPIWSGCFWGHPEAEGLPKDATGPETKVLQTDKITLLLDDKAQKLTAKMETDNGPMKIEMDKNGIVLTASQVTATVSADKILLNKTPASVEVAEAITLKKAAATVTVADSVALKNGAASVEVEAANINLKNGAASIAMSPASVSVNNGALEVI